MDIIKTIRIRNSDEFIEVLKNGSVIYKDGNCNAYHLGVMGKYAIENHLMVECNISIVSDPPTVATAVTLNSNDGCRTIWTGTFVKRK